MCLNCMYALIYFAMKRICITAMDEAIRPTDGMSDQKMIRIGLEVNHISYFWSCLDDQIQAISKIKLKYEKKLSS